MINHKRNLFRFTIFILVSNVLVCCSFVTAFSATKVDFTLNDYTTDNNRLFTISMTADCDKMLSAASFEFTYDKSMFEFRSAKASCKDSKIKYNELSDRVKLVFLNAYGKDITNGNAIFTLTFKAVKSGTGYIDFYVNDCVDSNICSIDAGNCTSAKITVKSRTADKNSNSSGNKNSEKSTTVRPVKESGTRIDRNNKTETTYNQTYDELGQLNSFDNPNIRLFIAGIVLGASIILTAMLINKVIKHIKNIKGKTE